jgi:hypothetical protein
MGTESQSVDYSAVLADLEARKAQIESAIEVIKGLTATGISTMPSPHKSSVVVLPTGNAVDIQSDAFFGLNIMDAAKKFLSMRKRPSSVPEIVEGLKRGGQVNANNEGFNNTLGSTLSRSETNSGPMVRVSRGQWGLREWYANKPRTESE